MAEEDVLSVIPVEKTIIDPLYEPLKLNRYNLCEHLQRLKDVSHLRYGFSPYLLFDVEGWVKVVKVVKEIDGENQLTKAKNCFDRLFKKYLNLLDGFKDAKNKRNALIKSLFECRNTILDVYKVIKMLFDVILIENMGRNELFGLKLQSDISGLEEQSKDFLNFIGQKEDIYDQIKKDNSSIEEKIESFREDRGNKLDELKEKTSEIKEKCNIAYYLIINSHGDSKKEELCERIKERINKITHIYQLNYPIKVTCPISKKEQFMCEEGKIYSMKEALLRTFELRRARWLYMSGSLHTVHRASTHTRLSHQIGSMIVGVNALKEIDVYPSDEVMMSLGEYLLMRSELHEFLMANFLHDIGHSPLSHVLEPNPFIELDHEEITRNLILGERTKEAEEMDWYVTERYLLKLKTIKEFEFRFFKNRYDPIYDVGKEKWNENERRTNFLDYLGKNDALLESEIVTVKEVLENFGVDLYRVVEILTGKMFCPDCKKTLFTIEEIESGKECSSCNGKINADEVGYEKIYDTQFLNKLIHSEIDLDRIDHVRRDSAICGLSLTSFRLIELLGSISVVLPDSRVYNDVYVNKSDKQSAKIKSPYIFVSEDGLSYVMDLLNSRRAIYNNVMFSDENNWINGVVNQITALAVRYLPHLTNMLPFITDQVLAHFYTNDLFFGTQIEKLNKLFHGKMDYSAYGKQMRYKLRDGVIVTKENLKGIYKAIEKINDGPEYAKHELPAVVFYTNIKPTKCPNCREKTLEEFKKMLCPSCKKELKEETGELKCKNESCDRFDRTIKTEEAIKVLECKACNTFTILIGPSEDLEVLLECPFYKNNSNDEFCGGKMKKQKRNHFECEKCGKRICKLIDESWDDIFVYEKKFAPEKDTENLKYFKFKELAGEYSGTSRERFPKRPSELDVKNLFYVWVSDFCDEGEIMERIKGKIQIEEMFVDLDEKEVTS